MNKTREELVADLRRRVADHILEPTNAALLERLIMQAVDDNEAVMIASLGTTYKRTGLHFDKRLERPTPEIHYLRRNKALSFGDGETPHRLIIGDNLHALQNLLIQYRGQVDVIYIDPPYGKDSMGQFAETNYENAITRDNLLSMLHPRLMLARQLLSDSGVIFCSIDDRNQAYVKCLFDDVFGERNFIATVIWERAYAPVNLKKHFSESHDYVLCFAKSIDQAVCNGLPRTEEANNRYSNPDNDPRGVWKAADCTVGPAVEEKVYEIVLPSGRRVVPASGRCWVYSKDRFDDMVSDGRIWFGEDGDSTPAVKKYLSEVKQGMTPMTIWKYTEVGHSQDATKDLKSIFGDNFVFPYPKPTGLIQRLCSLYGGKDALVLDFFAGSGTTGQAVLELNRQDGGNRRFILCQLNEVTDTTPNGIAHDVTAKRLKRVMTGECYDGTRDFAWAQKNQPYGGSLEVADIATVADFNARPGQSAFDVIDETFYGQQRFERMEKKVEWVCRNFEPTQVSLEGDREWRARRMEADQR
ncbi:MAG: site-specific DNA-methyltransferase [Bacteroidales bacterium]|nr:site-specific DNA-methyltransferase [Bacteroidales bacterium]